MKKAGFFTPFFSLHSPAFTTASRSEGFRRNLRGLVGGWCHRGLCGGIGPSRSEGFRRNLRGPGGGRCHRGLCGGISPSRSEGFRLIMLRPGKCRQVGTKIPENVHTWKEHHLHTGLCVLRSRQVGTKTPENVHTWKVYHL